MTKWNRPFPHHEIRAGDWIIEVNFVTDVAEMTDLMNHRYECAVMILTLIRPSEAMISEWLLRTEDEESSSEDGEYELQPGEFIITSPASIARQTINHAMATVEG